MWMVAAHFGGLTAQVSWSEGWRPPVISSIHSSNEPGELLQCLVAIINTIIIIITKLMGVAR